MAAKIYFGSHTKALLFFACTFLLKSVELHAQCAGLGSVSLTVIPPPVPTLNFNPNICTGQSTVITVNENFSTYLWSTGNTSNTLTVSAGSTYTVTVTNSTGCEGTAQAVVIETPGLNFDVTAQPFNCNGSLTLVAGGNFSNYEWSNGDLGATTTVSGSGTYTVTATNASGCTGSDTFVANIPNAPVVNITGNLLFCENTTTVLTATGGFADYDWSGGTASGNTTTVSNSGNYTVTVTDSFGCTATTTAAVNEQPAPQPQLNSPAPFCANATTVIEVLNPIFQNYTWSSGGSGSAITVSGSGTYTVTVTDAAGCTGTDAASVTILPIPNVSIVPAPYNCNGTQNLGVNGIFSDYEWSTGAAAPSISVTTNGTFTITVTNAAGCTGTDNFLVNIPNAPLVNITGDLLFCENTTTVLTATGGFADYDWSGGIASGNTTTVSNSGNYTVTVTDIFGCTATTTAAVNEQPAPQPQLNSPAPFCANTTTVIEVLNPIFQDYDWSSGGSGSSIIVSGSGTYTVTVTDAAGCTGTDTASVSTLPIPNVSIVPAPYNCNGTQNLGLNGIFSDYEWSTGVATPSITVTTNGTFSITVTNATGCTGTDDFLVNIPNAPVVNITGDLLFCENTSTELTATGGFVDYDWSGGAASGNTTTVFSSGNYTVTVTDNFGCTATTTATVNEQLAPQPQLNSPAPFCANTTTVIAVLNPIFQDYDWSNGGSGSAITVSSSGTYRVTVTDAAGCTGTDAATILVLQNPNVNIQQATYACDGQRILTATAGLQNYEWSNGASGATIVVNQTDTYLVTVTGTNGCTSTASVNAEIPDAPQAEITGASQICEGLTTTFSATAGFNFYNWSTGQNSQNIVLGSSGTYFVTVTDDFGCTATAVKSLIVNPIPEPQITGPTQICAGGTAIFNATGGSFATYLWSNSAATPSISVGTAGNYSLTVTNAVGCTGTTDANLTIGTSLNINIAEQPFQCNGQISLDAGTGFLTYNWSNSATTSTINVSVNGDFTVTVSDATGCTGTALATVTIPNNPQVAVTGMPEICQGTTTTLVATPGFVGYSWSNGQFNPAISVGTAGNFEVTATDGFGCQATASFDLSVIPAPQPQILGVATICENSTSTLSVNGLFQNYLWSTGETSSTIQVSAADNYVVTVSNAAGCSGSDAFIVNVNSSLQPQILVQPYACDGQITLDAGVGFQNYTWSNGSNTQTINVLQNGNYAVAVSDANGCSGTTSVSITIPTAPDVAITGNPVFCAGSSTALAATAGFQNYAWSGGQATAQISAATAGTYAVTATDAAGCTDVALFLVAENALPQPQILGSTTICNGFATTLTASQGFQNYTWSTGETTTQIALATPGGVGLTVTDAAGCTGSATVSLNISNALAPQIAQSPYACNGQITLDAGAGFQNYTWSNGANTQAINALQSGSFAVTVSDANGCSGTASISVTIPTAPDVAITGNPVFCAGGSTALAATTGFQNYAWSGAQTTAQITAATAGTYTVTATDANGCTDVALVLVTENALPQPQITGSTTICNGFATTLTASQGFQNYTWSTGETTTQIALATPGGVGLTVTDAAGCTGSATVSLSISNALAPQIVQSPYTCNGQIILDAGTGFQNYTWSNGTNTQTTNALQSGGFAVTVSDANGCSGTASISVTIPTAPDVAITGNPVFCAGGSTALAATAGFQNYAWSGAQTTTQITVTTAGTYTVTATDANGCTDNISILVTENALPQPQIQGSTTICNGFATTLTASQGFQNYTWSTGETTTQIALATPGGVGLTVTDAAGCTGSAIVTLSNSNSLTPLIAQSPYACDGQITLDAGAGFQNYTWSNGANTQTINALQSGSFAVTVSNANGCSGTASVSVTIPTAPNVTITGNSGFCAGSSTAITATAGFQNYAWSGAQTTAQITVTTAGTYTVTATDANGCTDVASFLVSENVAEIPQISGSSVICVNSSTILTVSNVASFSQFLWSNGASDPQISVNTAGIFSVTATDTDGCIGTATFEVTIGNSLAPTIDKGIYNCDENITLQAPAGFQNYTWSNGGSAATISVSSDGIYSLTVTDATGCTGTASIFVEVPEDILVVVQTPPTPICPGGSAQLSVVPGFSNYAWSSGENTSAIQISEAGDYAITVTDIYGCTATDNYEFAFAEIPDFEMPDTLVIDCDTKEVNIAIQLVNIAGTPTISWSTGATGLDILASAPGIYSATVTDANGCTASEAAEVLKISTATTFADTIAFAPGEVLQLTPLNLSFSPTSITWSPASILNCTDCLTVEARPTENIQVDFSGNSGDCLHSGYFYLITKAKQRPSVYAPNAILPESTQNNVFTLFSDGLELKINFLRVYTRWGELIVSLENLTPGDITQGWRGDFRGKLVDAGVFVWVAEVLYADGKVEVLKGDVTVFR